eukprot:Lankesteria_metandrocarpae@DN629_c0_g1_i1.p1
MSHQSSRRDSGPRFNSAGTSSEMSTESVGGSSKGFLAHPVDKPRGPLTTYSPTTVVVRGSSPNITNNATAASSTSTTSITKKSSNTLSWNEVNGGALETTTTNLHQKLHKHVDGKPQVYHSNNRRVEDAKKPLDTLTGVNRTAKPRLLSNNLSSTTLDSTQRHRRRSSLEMQLESVGSKYQKLIKENEELRSQLLQKVHPSENGSNPSKLSGTADTAGKVPVKSQREEGDKLIKPSLNGRTDGPTGGDDKVKRKGPYLNGSTQSFDMATVLELRRKEVENDALRGIEKEDRTQLYLQLEELLENCKGSIDEDTSVSKLVQEKRDLVEFVTYLMHDLKTMEKEKSKTAMESFQMEVILRRTVAELSKKCQAMEREAKAIQMRASVASNEFDALRSHLDSVGFHIEEALRSINANSSAETLSGNHSLMGLGSHKRYSYGVVGYEENEHCYRTDGDGDDSECRDDETYCSDENDDDDDDDLIDDTYVGVDGRCYRNGVGDDVCGGDDDLYRADVDYATTATYGATAIRDIDSVRPSDGVAVVGSKYHPYYEENYGRSANNNSNTAATTSATLNGFRADNGHDNDPHSGMRINQFKPAEAKRLGGDVIRRQELWNSEENWIGSEASSHLVETSMRPTRRPNKVEYSFVSRCFDLIIATRHKLNEAATVGEVTRLQVEFENQLKQLNQGDAPPPKL